jgi:hypothetical protein
MTTCHACSVQYVCGDCLTSTCSDCYDKGHRDGHCPACEEDAIASRARIDASIRKHLEAENNHLKSEVERLKDLLHRDRTGLAHALSEVRQIADGYSWLGRGEWGLYGEDEQTEGTLRKEIGDALDAIASRVETALRSSGNLAHAECCGRKPSPSAP